MVLVRDLDAAQDAYARMGFALTPRGFHTLGSQNHCIMFGRDYIELLAVPRPPAMQYFSDFLAAGEGLGAIALATRNAMAAHAELAAAGVAADPPLDFSRPVERLGEARFRIVQLPPDRTPGCRMFLCQHYTPELVWRQEYGAHAVGVTGIAGLAVVGAESAGYESVLGGRAQPIDEGVRVDTGSAPIALCADTRLRSRLDGVTLPARPLPSVAALFLRVADRAQAVASLRKGGFVPMLLRDGSCAIGADQANGVALVFG